MFTSRIFRRKKDGSDDDPVPATESPNTSTDAERPRVSVQPRILESTERVGGRLPPPPPPRPSPPSITPNEISRPAPVAHSQPVELKSNTPALPLEAIRAGGAQNTPVSSPSPGSAVPTPTTATTPTASLAAMLATPNKPTSAQPAPASAGTNDEVVPFLKMLKMGVPRGAVEIKMQAKGLDPTLLDETQPATAAPASGDVESSTTEPTPQPPAVAANDEVTPFLKMLKMGVPRGAVEIKMIAKGLDPTLLDAVPPAATNETPAAPAAPAAVVLLKDDPDYGPFFKMLAVGVPRPAVEIKMTSKQLDPAMLDLGANAPRPTNSTSSATATGASANGGGPRVAMLAALNKASDKATPTPQPTRPAAVVAPAKPKIEVTIPARFRKRRPSVIESSKAVAAADLRGIFWKPVAPAAIDNTIWAELPDGSPVPLESHLNVLQLKFAKAKASDMKRRGSGDGKDKAAAAAAAASTGEAASPAGSCKNQTHNCSLGQFKIDGKRQQNLGIALARLKVPFRAVRAAIVAMDKTILTTELVMKLQGLVPTAEEMEAAQSTLQQEKDCSSLQHREYIFDGADAAVLGRPEQFVLTMASIPRVSQRLQCLAVAGQLQGNSLALTKEMQLFTRGCDQFEKSARLRKLLHLVLCCGNVVNEGNPQRQGAWGFELTSGLPKLTQCKATADSKYTLVHWLSEVVATQAPELLDVTDELNHVEACLAIDIVALRTQARAISNNVALVKREIDTVSKAQEAGKPSEGDKAFLKFAKAFVHAVGNPNADCTAGEFGELEKRTTAILIKFGENSKTCTVQKLFTCVLDFCKSLKRAHGDTVKARLALEAKANPPMSPRSPARRATPTNLINAASKGSPIAPPRLAPTSVSPMTPPRPTINKPAGGALPPALPPRADESASGAGGDTDDVAKAAAPKRGGVLGGLKALGGFAMKRNKLDNKLMKGEMRNSLGRGQANLVTAMLARQNKMHNDEDVGGDEKSDRVHVEQKNV